MGALVDAGIARPVIANRTVAKAAALATRFPQASASGYGELRGPFDIVVNATAAGLSGEPMTVPPSVLGAGTLAYDMVYGRDTAFLQAAESFFVWRGVRPDTRDVLARLRGG